MGSTSSCGERSRPKTGLMFQLTAEGWEINQKRALLLNVKSEVVLQCRKAMFMGLASKCSFIYILNDNYVMSKKVQFFQSDFFFG